MTAQIAYSMAPVLAVLGRSPARPKQAPRSGSYAVRHAVWHAFWLALCWIALGCGGPSRPAVKHPATGPNKDLIEISADPADPGFLRTSATAATEEEAYREALGKLEAAIYGTDTWAQALGVSLHDPERDFLEKSGQGGGVKVTVGIERERLTEFLTQIAEQPWQTSLPAPFAEPVRTAYGLKLERFVCVRRIEFLGEECTAPDDETISAKLQDLAREIVLRPVYDEGVPVDAQGRPLRPIKIMAEHVPSTGARMPVVGLPLVAVQPEGAQILEATQATTDPAGMARFAFVQGAAWSSDVRVTLDRDVLLGPLASLWPDSPLVPTARTVGLERLGVVAVERVKGQAVADGHFVASLGQTLRERGKELPVAVPADAARALPAAQPRKLASMLPELADRLGGRLDVLILVEVDSEYASRMGTHRVWYEARGRARVYDAWTGKLLTTIEETVTAPGVGDERADHAARAQLATKLADRLGNLGQNQPAS